MEYIREILKNGFMLKTSSIKKNKSSFICNTNKGLVKISRTNLNDDVIFFIHDIKEHLYRSNYEEFDRFKLSVTNEPFYKVKDQKYVVTNYRDYQMINLNDDEQVLNAAKNIGIIHSKLINIKFSDYIVYGQLDILSEYKKNMQQFKNYMKKISSQKKYYDFDIHFIKNFDYHYNKMNSCIKILESINYSQSDVKTKHSVCHGKLKEDNILTMENNIFFENFYDASLQSHVFDLAFFIGRYIKAEPKNFIDVLEILKTYASYNDNFDKNDLLLLYPILKFPSGYMNICSEYYQKKRSWAPNMITSRLKTLIENRNHYETYIERIAEIDIFMLK